MARRDAELAHLTGGHDHGGLAAEDLGLGTDDVATDGGHYLSRFARSTGMGNKGNGRFQEAWRSVRCEPTIPFLPDRTSVAQGQRGSVRVDFGGRTNFKKKTKTQKHKQ